MPRQTRVLRWPTWSWHADAAPRKKKAKCIFVRRPATAHTPTPWPISQSLFAAYSVFGFLHGPSLVSGLTPTRVPNSTTDETLTCLESASSAARFASSDDQTACYRNQYVGVRHPDVWVGRH